MLAGCSSGASAPTGSPGTPASAAAGGTARATQHVTAGPLGLEIPAAWHTRAGSLNPSGNVTLLFAAPVDLPSDCQDTAQVGTCYAWPVMKLSSGGIVVAVRVHGMPGSMPPAGGDPITVTGLASREISGPADASCLQIGGSQLIQVVLPAIAGTGEYLSIDACIAGAGAAAAHVFAAIIASASVA
jgi:hypothetical protein